MTISYTPNITQNSLPAYVYQQYQGDDNIAAFFTAYNNLSQENLDALNNLQLPIYYVQSGDLLNFTALGIYGIVRQDFPIGGPRSLGPLNTWPGNLVQPNEYKIIPNSNSYTITDEAFKRVIQWSIFKGDGFQFTNTWLKRRCMRFLSGQVFLDNTYQISVVDTSETEYTITIYPPSGAWDSVPLTYALILQAGIQSGILPLPFQYTYVVNVS
jgi:hypothetical protein